MTDSLFHMVYIAPELARQAYRLPAPVEVLSRPDDTLVVYRTWTSGWGLVSPIDRVRLVGELALVQIREVLYLLPADALPRPAISKQDQALLRGIAVGKTSREIAAQLHLAEGTIDQYLKRLLTTFGAKNRAHLIAIAKDQGLI